jgi:general secretion pathway protein K
VVAVAASTAALMLAQQSAMLDQTMLVASRAQADQFARAGLDWARGVLMEDARVSGAYDGLDEPWARPIAGLPVERALVAGAISDEQAKFNLNNLVSGSGQKSTADMQAFARLLASVGLAPELADAVLDWIDFDDDATSAAGAENAYYLSLGKPYRAANRPMSQVEELYRVRGFDAAAVAKLRPYITALPVDTGIAHTTVNVNTASDIVLAALYPDIPKAKIDRLIAERGKKPLRSKTDITQWAGAPADALDVKSNFFSVRIQVAQDDVELALDSLVQRRDNGVAAIIWRRPRY